MLRFFQALMPREEKFFTQFNAHARTLVDGAVALRDLLEGGAGVAEACRRIVAHENEADAIARDAGAAIMPDGALVSVRGWRGDRPWVQ